MVYCHYHNKANEHVGSGIARRGDVEEAAKRAIGSAVDSGDTMEEGVENLQRGSMGCGASSQEAHQNAIKANSFKPQDIEEEFMQDE